MRLALDTAAHRKDLFLERALPPLLLIKAAALLDDALVGWMEANRVKLAKSGYRQTLDGRLQCMQDLGHLDARPLQSVRNLRNGVAHELHTRCTWTELRTALRQIQRALVSLGLASELGTVTTDASRKSQHGKLNDAAQFVCRYSYRILENEKPALELNWTSRVMRRVAERS